MRIQYEQAASLDQQSSTQEHFEAEIDLNIEHKFSDGPSFDKAASFSIDREQIHRELLSFVADRAVPDMLIGMRPEWERVPPIVDYLKTSSEQNTKTQTRIGSDNLGFTYRGKIYIAVDTSNSRSVEFAESIYNSRGSIGVAIADAVTQALRDHFFESSGSVFQTDTHTESGQDGTRAVERRENWQLPNDGLSL